MLPVLFIRKIATVVCGFVETSNRSAMASTLLTGNAAWPDQHNAVCGSDLGEDPNPRVPFIHVCVDHPFDRASLLDPSFCRTGSGMVAIFPDIDDGSEIRFGVGVFLAECNDL
jgi:hypothetical protein